MRGTRPCGLLRVAVIALIGGMLIAGCHRKGSDTSSGGGNSNQSLVTLKGAAQ